MAERIKDRTAAQPEVTSGEGVGALLEGFFRLPAGEQQVVLKELAPRVLGRLQEPGRDKFLAELRSAPRADRKMAARVSPGNATMPADELAGHVLRQPFEAQQRFLRYAAPRVAADLEGTDRRDFIEALGREIEAAEAGDPSATSGRQPT
jgi:hypothetical protein